MLKVIREAAVADGESAMRDASDKVHATIDRITGRSRASVPAPELILARSTEPPGRVTTKPAPLPRSDWSARLRAAAVVTCVLLACGSLGATCGGPARRTNAVAYFR